MDAISWFAVMPVSGGSALTLPRLGGMNAMPTPLITVTSSQQPMSNLNLGNGAHVGQIDHLQIYDDLDRLNCSPAVE